MMSKPDYPDWSDEKSGRKKVKFYQKAWAPWAVLAGIIILVLGALRLTLLSYDSEREIAGPVTLSTEWAEFTPESPLMPDKGSQEIVLDSAEPLVRNNLDTEHITLTDGTVVKVEVQFVDQDGNAFTSAVNRYPTPSLYENGISCSPPYLREDRIYKTVRVRSDRPLKLKRIVWHCWTGK